jgi:hypothetical protein
VAASAEASVSFAARFFGFVLNKPRGLLLLSDVLNMASTWPTPVSGIGSPQ